MTDLLIHMTRQDFRNDLKQFAETIRGNTPEKKSTAPEYLTRKETAKCLHISLVTLNRLTREGILKGKKIRGRVLYTATDIEQALSEMYKKHRR